MKPGSNKLKVLYVCRLFNGLEDSIKSKTWAPTGVPTIYKMINTLDADQKYILDLVVTSKIDQPDWRYGLFKKVKVKNLSSPLTVLFSFGSNFGRLGNIVQEMFQLLYLLCKVLFNRYDFLYIDHANIYTASIISRSKLIPVVFRLMGVYPAMRSVMSSSGLKNKIFRWMYKSPFSMIVCTQDGSGIEPWLNNAISSHVPVHKLINGIEYKKPSIESLNALYEQYSIPRNKTLILYLGKLEKIKGIYEFISAVKIANKECKGNIHGIVVGCGQELKACKEILLADRTFTLIPRIPHSEIFNIHEISDIYVSPNRLANLTNANLEAMSSGSVMVIPKSQSDTSVDLATDKLVSNKAVYRIDFPPSDLGISKAVIELFKSSELRVDLSNNVRIESKKFIPTWIDRIDNELVLIRSILVE